MSALIKFDAAKHGLSAAATGFDWRLLDRSRETFVEAISNVPLDSELGMVLYARSQIDATFQLEEADGKEIAIAAFVATGVTAEEAGGEIKEFARVCLFGHDLKTCWSSCSQGVLRSLNYVLLTRGWQLWEPPVGAKVLCKKTGGGYKYRQLVVLDQPAPAGTKKGG